MKIMLLVAETAVLLLQIIVLLGLWLTSRVWLRNYKELELRIESLEKIVHPMHLVQSFYGQGDINQEIHGKRHDPA
jgi:hypothetical protein